LSGEEIERDIRNEVRLEARLRALGTRNPRCTKPGCDETNPLALTGVHPNILCYEHAAEDAGRSWTERDHFAGQHNDPTTTEIPGNDHRIRNELQSAWPERTLRNPDESPLLKAAAMIRGWADALRVIIERVLAWVPPFLEWLDQILRTIYGEQWWMVLGWEG
jgi:hypothetical protein